MPTFLRCDGDDMVLAVRLTPRGAQDEIGGSWSDRKNASWLQVHVKAVPGKGKASTALIRFIAKGLSVSARDVTLESGHMARLKRLCLAGHACGQGRIQKELERL